MATPTFRAAGTAVFTANSVATPTNLSPTKNGSTVNGDLMLLVTESRSNTATVSTPITGWTLLTGFPVASGTTSGGKIYVFSRIADGTGSDAPTVTWNSLTTGTTGDSCGARILSWSNATTTQAGTVPTATDTAATTSWTMPAVTTTAPNCLAVGVSIKVSDTSQTATITTFTERSDDHTTTGTGHATHVSEKIQTTQGSTGTGTVTPSDTTSSRVLAVSLSMAAAATTVTLGVTTSPSSSQPRTFTKTIQKTITNAALAMSSRPMAFTKTIRKTVGAGLNAIAAITVSLGGAPPPEEAEAEPVRAASLGKSGRYRTSPSRNIRTTARRGGGRRGGRR